MLLFFELTLASISFNRTLVSNHCAGMIVWGAKLFDVCWGCENRMNIETIEVGVSILHPSNANYKYNKVAPSYLSTFSLKLFRIMSDWNRTRGLVSGCWTRIKSNIVYYQHDTRLTEPIILAFAVVRVEPQRRHISLELGTCHATHTQTKCWKIGSDGQAWALDKKFVLRHHIITQATREGRSTYLMGSLLFFVHTSRRWKKRMKIRLESSFSQQASQCHWQTHLHRKGECDDRLLCVQWAWGQWHDSSQGRQAFGCEGRLKNCT